MGRSSLAPNWSYLARLCLFLKLGLPAEGLGFAQGPDLHWTPQHTVRVEQSWLSGNWGWGWDGTLRPGLSPGSPHGWALLRPLFYYLSPCWVKGDQTRMLCPRPTSLHFAACLGLGVPVMIM